VLSLVQWFNIGLVDIMAKKPPQARGVYLSRKDKARVEAIANELGVTVHEIMKYAIMDFVGRYEAGEAKPKITTQPVLIPYQPNSNES
jgi:CRISPR/Cas system-associated exonuclease Cas4 (RecB family)